MAEWARGDLDTLSVPELWVSRSERAPRAQGLEVVQFETITAQVQLNILRKRAVADREDESVATNPLVIARSTPHHLLKEQIRCRRQAHSGTGMTVTYLLNSISRQNSSGVYRFIVDVIPLKSCHEINDPSASEVPDRERSRHVNDPPRDIFGSVGIFSRPKS